MLNPSKIFIFRYIKYILSRLIILNRLIFLSDEGPMLETLDYTIRIGSTPTFLYFDLYLYSAYAAHCVYFELHLFNKGSFYIYSKF